MEHGLSNGLLSAEILRVTIWFRTIIIVVDVNVVVVVIWYYATAASNQWQLVASAQATPFLHLFLALNFSMIGHIADYLRCLLDTPGLWIICDDSEIFALRLFEVLMIFRLALNASIFGQSADFGGIGNSCSFGLWTVCITIWPLFEAFVIFHAQSHITFVTLEAALVPDLI